MAAAIVLFGATGYTGRLTAQALVGRGAKPVLTARSEDRLRQLAHDLGGLEWITADVSRPETVRDAVPQGAVLVSTVGPFTRWGGPAIEAALAARASYLDSTGETPFIREVFERHGPRAEAAGCGLVTAFGYDWVPGNLAGALALREAGDAAVRVVVAYYFTGRAGTPSGGTRASSAGVMLEPSFAYRDGRIVTERPAKRMQEFQVDGKRRPAISVGSTEHFALPRLHPGLREVDVYLGWFGSMSRGLQVMSAGTSLVTKVPGVRPALQAVAGRAVKGSTGGPDEEARSKSGSHILAKAFGADGRQLTEVRVAGADGYTFTGEVLAWGAIRAAERGLEGTGALGPVDAFGLDELERGVASAGIERVL